MGTPLPGTKVIAEITVGNTDNTFALSDANYSRGGHHQVQTISDRNSITTDRRKEGMLCYVVSEEKTYRLIGGIDNDFWEEVVLDMPSFSDGSVVFADADGLAEDNDNLHYDPVNKRLGLGTGTPNARLDLASGDMVMAAMTVPDAAPANHFRVYVKTTGTSPNKEVAWCLKDQNNNEVIISSILI